MLNALYRLNPIHPSKPTKGFYKANRQRFLEILRGLVSLDTGYLLFKGPIEQPVYDDDNEFLLAGESNFSYLFGVDEPHTWGLIDLQTDRATLLVEESSPERSFWMKVKTLTDFADEFDGESVAVIKDLPSIIGLTDENKDSFFRKLYVMEGPNVETNANLHVPTAKEVGENLAPFFSNNGKIYWAIKMSRKRKSDEEIKLILHSEDVNRTILGSLLAYLKEGKTELQIAHQFGILGMYFGNYYPAFTPRISFGENGLKGFHNPSRLRVAKSGELAVIDAGMKVNGLASRTIRTVPISGVFSGQQRDIYEKVAAIYQRLVASVKQGVRHTDLVKRIEKELEVFLLAEKVCLDNETVILTSATIKKFYEADFVSFFGYDLADPLTSEFRRGAEGAEIEGQSTLFVKLAVKFDFEVTDGDVAVNQERVKELAKVVPAVKLGDVVVVGSGAVAQAQAKWPVDAKTIEESYRKVAQIA